jgi:diaminopimelate decarboxylase
MVRTGSTKIDDALSVRDGRLHLEELDVVRLADTFGTPLYALSEDQLRRNLSAFVSAFERGWPEGEVRILPSIKANNALAVWRILAREGVGCDTFGPGELHAALASGIRPDLISVNGSVKDANLVERAVAVGARITLDAARELDLVLDAALALGRRATIRFRVRPDYEDLTQPSDFAHDEVPIREVARAYKPGIPTEELVALGRRALESESVDVAGLHAHLGRHSKSLEVWRGMVRAYVGVIARLCEEWNGWRPREIDVGGGFATRRDPTGRLLPRLANRDPNDLAPEIEEVAEAVTSTLRTELVGHGLDPRGIVLEVEPGRSLFADAGIHLATVRNVKRESTPAPFTWVETDTTEMFLPDSLIEHSRWRVLVANRADRPATQLADVVGMSCGFDVMVPAAELPEVEVGDVLAFLDTGAYQDAVSSNFNALPRPATVLVHGREAEVVKRAETIDDVFSRHVVPERLRGSG